MKALTSSCSKAVVDTLGSLPPRVAIRVSDRPEFFLSTRPRKEKKGCNLWLLKVVPIKGVFPVHAVPSKDQVFFFLCLFCSLGFLCLSYRVHGCLFLWNMVAWVGEIPLGSARYASFSFLAPFLFLDIPVLLFTDFKVVFGWFYPIFWFLFYYVSLCRSKTCCWPFRFTSILLGSDSMSLSFLLPFLR